MCCIAGTSLNPAYKNAIYGVSEISLSKAVSGAKKKLNRPISN